MEAAEQFARSPRVVAGQPLWVKLGMGDIAAAASGNAHFSEELTRLLE